MLMASTVSQFISVLHGGRSINISLKQCFLFFLIFVVFFLVHIRDIILCTFTFLNFCAAPSSLH